ncbi:MAG: tetratricopeptide repeat protein [Mariniphaga sp.]|nr:tetratricopeptide repeat protein [Mariniphaga sp.]MDD4225131.1 tetratricopeptide repeat protein [Mariniphaga sp.]MDD4424645.1 tetratricopeptide repeat protein [Mariniphaga sp.]
MQQEKFYSIIENPGVIHADSLIELREIIKKYPYFQAGWILYLKNLKDTENPEFETILKKTALLVPDRKKLFRLFYSDKYKIQSDFYLNPAEKPKENDHKNKKSSPVDLIEKFLLTSPGPIRMEKTERTNSGEEFEKKIISKSTAETDEIITETLANIYVEQKKYDKALDAFQRLSLKYPEKSIYFATRIKEIEKLKNI